MISRQIEEGQIVSLRHKVWTVIGVSRSKTQSGGSIHKVSVECLSDIGLGRVIDVIWEREVEPHIIEAAHVPKVTGLDSPIRFQAYLDSIRWSSSSLAEGNVLQAPFRGGVQLEEYQLVPVLRALAMPRVTLLIADDVGLGKTIEAGLVAQELIHTHRAQRILVVCPAHLKSKWADEMAEKFGLEFRVIDRDAVLDMRREFGPTVNPWASYPRLITSIDYIKTEHPRRLFEELLAREQRGKGLKPWDLLILDEAHNAAPAGRGQYIRDSDRTSLLRAIADHFEHKLFLTATPHNGYRESFTGLLELLDNLRFSRGTELDRDQLKAVTIRRLKEDIRLPDGRRRFPPRVVLPRSPELQPELYVDLSESEQEIFHLLRSYTQSRLQNVDKRKEHPTQFVLTLLKKRALSSPMALRETLITHLDTAGVREELGVGDSLFRTLEEKEHDDWSDDDEKEDHLTATTEAASRLCEQLTAQEKSWLTQMFSLADALRKRPDTKAQALINWLNTNLLTEGKWNQERLIIFTEYRHTLEYLRDVLSQEGMGDALLTIYGGMPDHERDEINKAFNAPVEENSVRILLATDAASEGADFQKHCRNLVHYEIPWNPIRLEQRNGRIDRHGQEADEVRIHHFVYRNQEDSEFLKRIVDKVETIRTDLGSVGAIIAENVRLHALGKAIEFNAIDHDPHCELARQEMQFGAFENENVTTMVRALNDAKSKLGITDERQIGLLREALAMEGKAQSLSVMEDGVLTLSSVPSSWSECRKFVNTDASECHLTFRRPTGVSLDKNVVLHLDHPIMKRAIATLRSQMWRTGSAVETGLHRVTAEVSDLAKTITLIVWGRLILSGPERNLLHEGLVAAAAEIDSGGLTQISERQLETLLDGARVGFTGSVDEIKKRISTHLISLESLLRDSASKRAEELADVLATRGLTAEKQARGLVTERLSEIRKTIKKWEQQAEDHNQMKLFDNEVKAQREHDLQVLRARLVELEAERDVEPKRQRSLYKVSDSRVFPIALQILLPSKLN
jgi:ERCC4-related helicase